MKIMENKGVSVSSLKIFDWIIKEITLNRLTRACCGAHDLIYSTLT